MLITKKLPFKYVLEATPENPNVERTIETPWNDDNLPLLDQIQHSEIYRDNGIIITEQIHDSGFHLFSIQTSTKIIDYTNWELDYVTKTNTYIPRKTL
ncbi:hypothetical protein [Mammaliicoccus sciuri]|uniref:hypothetical protein n=1 Tax=Mammaliicoccus sciuri TaxID=1296 RepID=UPI002B258C1D|nr:hypothetical protein [Mammaliicoccus sciuri]WQK43263.1 hypothetical protein P3T89_04395 [Mammaliicoccus sciuri]